MRKEPMDMGIEELIEQRALIESYLLRAVQQARRDGITWAMIGNSLGVSHQEAHRKYSWIEKTNRAAPPADTGL